MTFRVALVVLAMGVVAAAVPADASEASTTEFVVTFDGPTPAGTVDRMTGAGAVVLGPGRNGGIEVRSSAVVALRLAALPGVADVVPALRAVASPLPPGVEGVDGLYLVRFDIDSGPASIEDIPGVEILEVSDTTALVSVAPGALAGLEAARGVAGVEEFAFRTTRNDQGGGALIGSDAAEALGYDGTGQIIGIADSGLGGGTPATAHRDIPAGRITAIHDWPGSSSPGCWVAYPDGSGDPDNGHGTHVAGSAVSAGDGSGVGRGTAPGASLVFQSIEDIIDITPECGGGSGYFLVGIPLDSYELPLEAYGDGARVHSNSWGTDDAGAYNADSSAFDAFVWDHPDMTILVAGGNAGADLNGDGVVDAGSIGSPATGKNVIAVGASENVRAGGYPCDAIGVVPPFTDCAAAGSTNDPGLWGNLGFVDGPLATDPMEGDAEQMAAFSSRGPAQDGRIKPDVVAPGTWILSTYSDLFQQGYDGSPNPVTGFFQTDGWGYPYDAFYKYNSGTSMSAPLVAGGAAVIRQYFDVEEDHNPSAALVKAMIINSAVDMADENNDGVDDNDFPIPNIHEGWGRVNLAEAVDGDRFWFDSAAAETGLHTSYRVTVPGGAPVKVTLVWSDYPAAPGASSTLVNDLDLVVTAPNGTVHRGNRFSGGWSVTGGTADRVNNVENAYLQTAAGGTWTIQVRGHDVPFGPQPFALVVDGATGTINAAPGVVMLDPVEGSQVSGDTVLRAAATDDTGVVSVRFSIGSTVLGTDTNGADGWTMPWNISSLPDGPVTVTARATDGAGLTATDSVVVEVDRPDPAVSLTAPSDGSIVAGLVAIAATAANATQVEFFVDGESIGLDSSSDGGWTAVWDTAGFAEDAHVVSAVALGPTGPDAADEITLVVDNLGPGGTFVDDDFSEHQADIEAFAAAGVTRGCNPPNFDRFCPDDPVTRGQMAAFLNRAIGLEASSGDRFLDDDESVFEADIEALAAAGITLGCNPPRNDRFCADDQVTRAQMAAFLVRGFNLPPEPGDRFADDNGSVFEEDIEALAAAGITRGCNPPFNDRFCPEDTVSRAQMASFIVRALGLDPLTP
ncbi:MAG: S8 family serine peptidase [Acidimicrobiia bacterium]